MKKMRYLCFLLALVTIFNSVPLTVFAAETQSDPTSGTTEAVEETTGTASSQIEYTTNYGDISVTSGCRTIEGQVPLAGSDKMLETAQSAFVYEMNSETIVYAYNPDLKMLPATLSKVLVAMIICERGNLDDRVTISMREISNLPPGAIDEKLKEGEQLSVRDLLYCMMLSGANDACLALAEYIAGDEKSFVKIMNERAAELGCTNTYFVNCHGLDNTEQYTTARDLARIVMAAIENDDFREVFAANSYTVAETNKSEERKLKSTNYLREETIVPKFNDDRVTGGKSGATDYGGRCLVATAEDGDMSMIYIIMGAVARISSRGTPEYYGNYEEMIELLEFGFSGFRHIQLLYEGQAFTQFPVADAENVVIAEPKVYMTCTLPKETQYKNLIIKYSVANGGLSAPIKAGEKVGSVQLWYQSSCLAEVDLFAMHDVRTLEEADVKFSNAASRDDSNTSGVFAVLGGILVVVLVAIGGFFGFNALRRAFVRTRRRRRRRSRRRSR